MCDLSECVLYPSDFSWLKKILLPESITPFKVGPIDRKWN